MVERFKYLGAEVEANRDCFRLNRVSRINLAHKMSNVTYSVISRACERMLIGKVYWKSVVLPGVLSVAEVMPWNENELDKLQRIENGVWRKVLRAPDCTAIAALQGEIGCSSVRARDIKIKLMFAKHLVEGENSFTKMALEKMKTTGRGGRWYKLVSKYLGD